MRKETIIEKLSALMHLDYDAIGAYNRAIEHIDVAAIRDQMQLFVTDHGRHVHDLKAAIERLGGEPPKDPGRDLKGFLIEGVTAVRSLLGTVSALKAMRANEKLTNKTYEEALQTDWPSEIAPMILRHREDEARHLAYIEMAIEQLEQDAAAAKSAT
jgi:rubrerythrin